ncbi:MAG: ribonuclease E inhibitor RraB [Asticcacaulis sp.]
MDWPNDADGDVFRRLKATGFNFSSATSIDFIVDFETWPPESRAMELLKEAFPEAEFDSGEDYLVIILNAKLAYGFVTETQNKISELLSPFNAQCDSWGVLQV